MNKKTLSYEVIQSMLLEKMQARRCSAVSITSGRYLSNSIFKMMKSLGYQTYCEEGSVLVLKAYLEKKGPNQPAVKNRIQKKKGEPQ